MIQDFTTGFIFFWQGWNFVLSDKRLRVIAIVPSILAVLIGGAGLWILFTHLGAWIAGLVAWLLGGATGFWATVLYYPLWLAAGLLVLVLNVFLSYVLFGVISIPFHSYLAESSLGIIGVKPQADPDFRTWLKSSARMLRVSLVKASLFLIVGVFLFMLSFVPVLGVLAAFGTLLLLAFDMMDYTLEALRLGFRARVAFMFRHKMIWFGMAAALALTLFVPGLTLLVTPGAVAGGTLLYRKTLGRPTE
ncbi:MAG: EI24 domain-containing protein [Bdellovibrionales bacterium]